MELIRQNTEERQRTTEHGGNLYEIAEETGIPEDELIDFSASINPLGVSEKVRDVIHAGIDGLVNYPDPETTLLRRKLAEHYDIGPAAILCGNGSTELIYLIPRALQPERVLIPSPSFSEYEKAVSSKRKAYSVTAVREIKLNKENKFEINPDKYIEQMIGCDMAFLCNPNNPTGTLLGRHEVLRIAEAARAEKCLLVVDEAFIDFCPEESVINHVKENPYLIVLRSMTKFYALTGLRIGYGIIHGDLIKTIRKFKEPWTVNNLAQKAAVAAIDDHSYIQDTVKLMSDEKKYMEKSFRDMGVEFSPSAANFYLLKMKNAGHLVNELKQKGLVVRDCSNFKGLDSSYVRVAVKSHTDNERLIEELSKL
ncbi:MAG: threonine-phosphate decarboxylase CobD [Nitrospirota bacterium]